MPNRILRDWTNSKKISNLSPEAERLFVRLIMKVDDYGRFYANPLTIRNVCFPHFENVSAKKVSKWMTELTPLLQKYSANGEDFIEILDFRQRLRVKSGKYPDSNGVIPKKIIEKMSDTRRSNDGHVSAKSTRETETYNVETETEGNVLTNSDLSTIDKWIEQMKVDELWLSNAAKSLSRPYEFVKYNLQEKWKPHIITYQKKPQSFQEFRKHFVNWLRVKNDTTETSFNPIADLPPNY